MTITSKAKISYTFYLERQNPLYKGVVKKLLDETFADNKKNQRVKSGEVKDWLATLLEEK